MPIPFLIAGVAVGVAAAVLTSDKKKEPEAKTSREKISASDVPKDIRRQIEGRQNSKADTWCRMANEYYKGLNGRPIDLKLAKEFYKKAANAGNQQAAKKLMKLFPKG